jgi:hypothetical protein
MNWTIYNIEPETKRKIKSYAGMNGLKLGEAIDELAKKL